MTNSLVPLARRSGLVVAGMLGAIAVLAVACDDKPSSGAGTAPSAEPAPVATPSATPTMAPPPPPPPISSTGSSTVTGDAKDVMVIVRDPVKEPEKTVKAALGGSLTLFLPDYAGTSWSVLDGDKPLGKSQEEVVPGFAAGGTMGHQFKWKTGGRSLSAGQKIKIQLVNKKTGDKSPKPNGTFALTIEIG